ncbi:hypothetical protein C5C36_16300 [Rathayibacter sp. AY1G1]|uniref:hypothetical protein n=1 Tax=Rathayibacter sp. AY1G1 TaxID=2080564 RepID=UPI000CE8B1A4|nr:hypothetical protein [Rathayibacter sp. AY1G1]PPH08390.1 hypothetical protein C5C36_16300 [Rathayibacter sp. AY1G1]
MPQRSDATLALAAVFLVWSPAAAAAGWWLLLGLAVAAAAAALSAVADAGRTVHDGPSSEWLGIVGRAFASAALALTAAQSVLGGAARPLAVLLLVAVALFGLRGGRLPARPVLLLVGAVVVLLAAAAVIVLVSPPDPAPLDPLRDGGPLGAGTAAALLLILLPTSRSGAVTALRPALLRIGIATAAAAALGTGLLLAAGPEVLASSETPLSAVTRGTPASGLVGAAAVIAVLLALLDLGRRDARALVRLAGAGEIPAVLATRNRRTGVPAAAQLVLCLVAVLAVVILDADALLAFAVAALLVATIVRRLDHGAAGASGPALASAAVSLLLLLALPAATAAAAAVLLAALLIARAFRT